jgi:hydroxyquinol 1,2-dioxygenase
VTLAGFAKLVTHLFLEGSEYLESDVVFGVKRSLIRRIERRAAHEITEGHTAAEPYYVLRADFKLAPEERLTERSSDL